jgi:4a-hydroxytetrahydrobiopterin dehydratase
MSKPAYEPITATEFHSAEGVGDWRVVFEGACAYFRTGSFAVGAKLAGEIALLADQLDHDPDVDLRPDGVTVRLMTHAAWGLTDRDLTLARQISAAASSLGLTADPGAVQTVQITIDAHSRAKIMPFWRTVLGYEAMGDEDLLDPHRHAAGLWFQEMEPAREGRNRIHVDVSVPHDQAEARVAAAVAAGGRIVNDANAPQWWTLADPEGNEVDIATWQGRDLLPLIFRSRLPQFAVSR